MSGNGNGNTTNSTNTTKKYLSGCITGLANTVIFYPMDLLRVRYFFKKKNIGTAKTFYNGLTYTLWTGCLKNMATYPTQEVIYTKIKENTKVSDKSALVYSSIGTGSILGLLANPINTIKVPMQATKRKTFAAQIAKDIYKNYGLKGFYRGGVGVVLRDITWATVYFPLYKTLEDKTNNRLVSSLSAGVLSMALAYPFDGMRLYRQHHLNDYNLWHGFRESFKINQHNLRSFGMGIIRVPLSVTFGHMVYLYTCDLLN